MHQPCVRGKPGANGMSLQWRDNRAGEVGHLCVLVEDLVMVVMDQVVDDLVVEDEKDEIWLCPGESDARMVWMS